MDGLLLFVPTADPNPWVPGVWVALGDGQGQAAVNPFTTLFLCPLHCSAAYDGSPAKKRRAGEPALGVPVNKRKSLLMKPRHYCPSVDCEEGRAERPEAEGQDGPQETKHPPSAEEIVIKPGGETLHSAAQENSEGKEDTYGCYRELVVKSLMHLGKFEKNASVQMASENLNDSGIQSLRAEGDEADECFMIHSDDGGDKTEDSRLRFCSSSDNESNCESAENGWDSGSNFSDETKPQRVPKYALEDDRKDLLEAPEIKMEGDEFLSCENACDSAAERRDPEDAQVDPTEGRAQPSFPGRKGEDLGCPAAGPGEAVDLEKAKGNLSLLEHAIALQAERGCVFHHTYKELDRFLLEHLSGERRQTKVIDVGGRQVFNNKHKEWGQEGNTRRQPFQRGVAMRSHLDEIRGRKALETDVASPSL
ncbi:Suppression of tumorigenicity 18 protein [Camelus dromedarius]|uniref:Suppression of tumorigenicity 18 protein n=1 Tax=Camelus dromedarius TaxID=9838 RepID=A0A5N4CCT2_CAMDR|nr:Suppression of tumorigenicity 18 protein [Camelus dromedarius]